MLRWLVVRIGKDMIGLSIDSLVVSGDMHWPVVEKGVNQARQFSSRRGAFVSLDGVKESNPTRIFLQFLYDIMSAKIKITIDHVVFHFIIAWSKAGRESTIITPTGCTRCHRKIS